MSNHIAPDYSQYIHFVNQICDSGCLDDFKRNRYYADILEHVSAEQGKQYLDCIHEKTPYKIEDIVAYCTKNDSIGNPHTVPYQMGRNGETVTQSVSPTSLRYVYQSFLILSHIKDLEIPEEKMNLIEIGAGYGGLCVALYFFSSYFDVKIRSYRIIDLPEVIRLQSMFHSLVGLRGIEYYRADTFGKDIDQKEMFCVSNYCFSEINLDNQYGYCYHLFPKVSHGFMCWNSRTPCSIPFVFQSFREIPNTAEYNQFIYF